MSRPVMLYGIAKKVFLFLYNENKKIGENGIVDVTKEFACEIGFDNWHENKQQ